MKVTTRWECMRIVAEQCYVCNEVVKTWRVQVCRGCANFITRNRPNLSILMGEMVPQYQDPPQRL